MIVGLSSRSLYPPMFSTISLTATDTGLYYLQSRYYDPEIGRFINADGFVTTDVLGLLSSNMFVYCENNPISRWGFTFIKTKMLTKEPRRGTLKPWNVLTLSMTYGRFRDPEIYSNFFSFAKSVITDIDPFYARLDDIANGLDVFHSVNEDCFEPGRIQQIYWGNYLGSDYCEKYNVGDGSGIPAYSVEKLGNGVFFTLSDNVLDFASEECVRRREMLRKHFDLKVRTKKEAGQ